MTPLFLPNVVFNSGELNETKPRVILPARVCAATTQTSGFPTKRLNPPNLDGATRAPIAMTAPGATTRQGQIMATRFVEQI
jgi:hypothetical protein